MQEHHGQNISDTPMKVLCNSLLTEEVKIYSLILSSSGIEHYAKSVRGGWELWVEVSKFEYAYYTINEYLLENSEKHSSDKDNEPVHHKSLGGA